MLTVDFAKNKIENQEGINHLWVQVKPEVQKQNIHKPVAIVVVIDHSVSMGSESNGGYFQNPICGMQTHPNSMYNMFNPGKNQVHSYTRKNKLDYAKQAAEQLVSTLRPEDRFALVSFGDYVTVNYELTTVTDHEKWNMRQAIQRVQLQGSTNISGALEQAASMISESIKQTHHIKILLLSDGQANIGIADPEGIAQQVQGYREKGISISTIGIGLDYNSYFMETIATTSGGMFYHLTEMAQLSQIFEKEWTQIRTLTTKNARLKVISPSFIKRSENLNGFTERMGELYLGQVYHTQDILFELGTENAPLGDGVFEIILTYENSEGQQKQENIRLTLPIVEEKDMEKVTINQKVAELVKKMIQAQAQKEAMRRYERQDVQGATQWLTNSTAALKNLHHSYGVNVHQEVNSVNALSSMVETNSLQANETKMYYAQSFSTTRGED